MRKSEIKITDSKPGVTLVDIEGVIGVPEEWQFDNPAGRVATYEKFQQTLAAIARIRGGEVIVNIRSTGGDVGDALLIHDALTASSATITTRCYGYAASAATIIAQAASEGRREVSANSLYLIHNSVSSCEGNTNDLQKSRDLLAKTDQRIAAIYAARSGRTAAEFAALMAENNGSGRWLSPEETIAEGLADRIVECEYRAGKKQKPLAANSADAEALRRGSNLEIARLSNRISSLEHASRQQNALPTELKEKEDPSPTEIRRTDNENAYIRDAERFRH